MHYVNSKDLIVEIQSHAYRLDILLSMTKEAENGEIRLNLIKARDHLQNVLDLLAVA